MSEEAPKETDAPEENTEEEIVGYQNMMVPPLEEIVDKVGSKFLLVTLAARRANDINRYYQGLGSGIAGVAPPQVSGDFASYLSTAFEELHKDKVELSRIPPEVPEDVLLSPSEEKAEVTEET